MTKTTGSEHLPQRERDLGFGSVVARESRTRLLNRDGTFNVPRKGLGFWSSLSLYHWLLTLPWNRFFLLVAATYVAINALFASAYFIAGPDALVPRAHGDRAWLPGSLDGAVGVVLDWGCPRDQLKVVRAEGQEPVFVASGFPRPIPGVSPQRNLKGVSFAAANTTGILANLMQNRPELKSVTDVLAMLE